MEFYVEWQLFATHHRTQYLSAKVDFFFNHKADNFQASYYRINDRDEACKLFQFFSNSSTRVKCGTPPTPYNNQWIEFMVFMEHHMYLV